MGWPRIATAALDIIIGDGCAACAMPGPPLCDACLERMPVIGAAACVRCGHPWPAPCEHCPQCIAGLAIARQAVRYDPPVPEAVRALKDSRRRAVAHPLAGLIVRTVPRPADGAVLVPVPLAPARMADRGFNQAALIARALAAAWDLPVDDVVTTGATLTAAARALRAAGCARVGAVSLARVALAGGGTRVG